MLSLTHFTGLSLALLALFGAFGDAVPVDGHMLHEKLPAGVNTHWRRGERVSRDAIIPLRIGLTQQNLDSGYERLMEVSHPASPKYGQHLTAEEVHSIFAPHDDAVREVRQWLVDTGVDDSAIVHSDNKGWLAMNIPAHQVEKLFRTTYHEYEHIESGSMKIGCDEYHVPSHIKHHFDYITPGVKLSAPVRKRVVKRSHATPSPARLNGRKATATSSQAPAASSSLPADLQNCDSQITPPCLRALYNIPIATSNDPNNTLGIYEDGDHYSQADLDMFYATFATQVPKGTSPIPAFIDGAQGPVAQSDADSESNVDIQLAYSLIYPQTITLYQTDDIPQAAEEGNMTLTGEFNTFLDAIDGSYCTFTDFGITGDSPGIDPEYPDTANPDGFQGKLQCGTQKPARVTSFSYATSEDSLPMSYQERQCNEFMKLSLQGHTFFFASGDQGVASDTGVATPEPCISGFGQDQTIFSPSSPVNCPFVTVVGSTTVPFQQTVNDPETASSFSGGGFSNYFSAPDYQTSALNTYFSDHDPGYPSYVANANATNIGIDGGVYNRAGRGYPDVSANGFGFLAFVQGQQGEFFGTSIATPVWASVITLINGERTAAGKSPVGFINPVLYENPSAMNDVTSGSNSGCGSQGFSAVQGWDPITGLGTPDYPSLLKVFMDLP